MQFNIAFLYFFECSIAFNFTFIMAIKDFLYFLTRPRIVTPQSINTFSSFLKIVWKSFLLILVISILQGLITKTLLKVINIPLIEKPIILNGYSILRVTLLTPFIEESLYRLPLRISKFNLVVFFCVLIYVILLEANPLLSVCIALVISGFLYFLMIRNCRFYYAIKSYHEKYFHIIFYSSALIFGFMHLTKYSLDLSYFIFFPLFILNYVLVSLVLGYVRVSFDKGFFLALIIHAFLNGLYCLVNFN